MSPAVTLEDFPAFFRALNHGRDPFPWQIRLAQSACTGVWPEVLALPTGTGKTSCLDIAVFAMAVRQAGPRRVFFVVDRRVVVDQAYEHMQEMCELLRDATDGVLANAAAHLRLLGGLPDAYEMRGGIYRDDSWVRSPVQPMLIASTVDQIGSRLLFRGYGASESTWPLHAALTANDSLIFLDEAHCSAAFEKTVRLISQYRTVAAEPLSTAFEFVRMTATPASAGSEVFGLDEADYRDERLRKRLYTSKKTTLEILNARPKEHRKIAERLTAEALRLADSGMRRVAVMVNRVRTAKAVYALLEKERSHVHLLIGRMRPVDRQELHRELQSLRSGSDTALSEFTTFVVATQCLEVGADLDFDGLVTECASIDALLQRFGRLDRVGRLEGAAKGSILIASYQSDEKYVDPVYGAALSNTWKWLQALGPETDFCIKSDDGAGVPERVRALSADGDSMRRQTPLVPALLPTHLDLLAQTSPQPRPEPDVHVFLHGKESTLPDVHVVWRADLTGVPVEEWSEIVGLCPPVTSEAMSVPLAEFRRWLTSGEDAEGADVESGDLTGPNDEGDALTINGLVWRGVESEPLRTATLRPGDTVILDAADASWLSLGHIPAGCEADAAERARLASGKRCILRIHPAVVAQWPQTDAWPDLASIANDEQVTATDIVERIQAYQRSLPEAHWLRNIGFRKVEAAAYPTYSDGRPRGWVIFEKAVETDFGADESSVGEPVRLDSHLSHVTDAVRRIASRLLEDEALQTAVVQAAQQHDVGKSDMRFQALLRGGDRLAAQLAPIKLAKGTRTRTSRQARAVHYKQSGLPEGFRHELRSLSMLTDGEKDDLVLHLIAAHHGRCRPFAPFVDDPMESRPAHHLDAGVADRYWKLTRRFGWWGLAYLEAILRLGDWQASAEEANDGPNRH